METHEQNGEADADELILEASATEPDAFGRFYDRHARDVLSFFYSRVASAQTAADLTAESFAAAFAFRHRYRSRGSTPRAWLFGIAKHQLSRYLRRQRIETRARERLGVGRLEVDDLSMERIEDLVDHNKLLNELPGALNRLRPGLRRAVELRILEGLDYREVAKRLGCSQGAARVRVSRALTQLYAHYEGEKWDE